MRLDRAHERARAVRTPLQAARLHNDIDYELAMGEHNSDDERQGEVALRHLQGRFPGVEEAAREVDRPPALSRKAGETLASGGHGGRRRRASAPPARPRQRKLDERSGSSARGAAGRSPLSRAGSAASSAYDATGSWGQLVGDFFVWGAALSIGYLLITKAAATGKLFQGITNAVRAVISPHVDPLNPRGAL
ncbi:MAG TPA: hypothetical protein VG325_17675 [Solirubrobacteraceae bacterium]|jgi:hypothetical protein|nr:hypothetical protein [Solirubrobacteraceae bacterium]